MLLKNYFYFTLYIIQERIKIVLYNKDFDRLLLTIYIKSSKKIFDFFKICA